MSQPNPNPNPQPTPTPPSNPPPAPAPAPVTPPAGDPPAAQSSSPAPSSTEPIEVKYELKTPEGSPLKPEDVQAVTEFAKANKLSPEVAQAILERDSQAVAANRRAQEAAYEQQAAGWKETVLKDSEIGGSPEKLQESAALAHRVFQQFGSPELGRLFATTSLGNHPELIRLAVRFSKAIGNDSFVIAPSSAPAKQKSAAEAFWPTTPKS